MSKEHIVLEVMPSNWFRARSTNSRRISMLLRCRSVFWCLDYIWLHGKHQSHLAKKGMKGDTNSSQNCCRRVSWCFLLNWNCAKLMFLWLLWLLCVVFSCCWHTEVLLGLEGLVRKSSDHWWDQPFDAGKIRREGLVTLWGEKGMAAIRSRTAWLCRW